MSKDPETFAAKYAPPGEESSEDPRVHPISGELLCFGGAKDNRRPPAMVILRLKTGDQKALMYSYLVEVDFNPSDGVLLRFVSHEVTITGRNLDPLFRRLVEHGVTWIEAVDESKVADEEATVVAAIEIKKI